MFSLHERFKRPFVISASNPIFLALVAIILIGISISLLPISQKTPSSIFLTENLVFTTPFDKERFEELISLGLGTKNRSQSSNYLIKAFWTLTSEYNRQPSVDKRQTLSKLANYLEKNFPAATKKANLVIPCKEAACGAVFSFSDELLAIKDQITNNQKLDQLSKQTINLNLENVALAAGNNNKAGQFNSLSTAFYNLKSVWQKEKDPEIEKLAKQVLAVIEKTDSEQYQFMVKRGFLILNET